MARSDLAAIANVRGAVALMLMLALLGAGLGFATSLACPWARDVAADEQSPVVRPSAQPAVDRYGDPLPALALTRLGTRRLHHTTAVVTASFSPDGKVLASTAMFERDVRLWRAADGKELGRLAVGEYVKAAAFSPDGKWLAVGVVDPINKGRVELWDPATRRRRLTIDVGATAQLSHLHFAPDSKSVAAVSTSSSDIIHLWDARTGEPLGNLEPQVGAVGSIAFSPDGKRLLSAAAYGEMALWDVATGKKLRTFKGDGGTVWSLVFAADGEHFFWAGNAGIRLWAVATGKEARLFPTPQGGTTFMAVSPDATTLAADTYRFEGGRYFPGVQLWDVATGKVLRRFDRPREEVGRLSFSPDGKTLASTGNGGNTVVRLLDLTTGKSFPPLEPAADQRFNAAVFSSDGKVVAAANGLWDVATGRQLSSCTADGYQPSGFSAFSPDGKTLATTSVGRIGGVHLWDAATRKHLATFGDEPKSLMRQISYCDDGQRLATVSSPQETAAPLAVRIWDIPQRKTLSRAEIPCDGRHPVALSRDGSRIATDGYADGSISLWDSLTGKQIHTLRGPQGMVVTVAFSADGRTIAGGAKDRSLCWWDVASGNLLRRVMTGPDGGVSVVVFSPDQRMLASGHGDGTVCLWELATGQLRMRFQDGKDRILCLSFSADGRRLLSGSGDGTAVIWEAFPGLGEENHPVTALDRLWKDLASQDAAVAFGAMRRLAQTPVQTARLLGQRLRPVRALDQATEDRIRRLIRDLDANDFATREKASQALASIGEAAAPLLRAMLTPNLPLEVRRRIQQRLDDLDRPAGERLQTQRALEVLEHAHCPEAHAVLKDLAGGLPEAWLTRQARLALERHRSMPMRR